MWRNLLTRLINRASTKDSTPRTTISDVEWTIPPRGQNVTELTEDVIRANEGDSWQPPPPARRDARRPRSDRW